MKNPIGSDAQPITMPQIAICLPDSDGCLRMSLRAKHPQMTLPTEPMSKGVSVAQQPSIKAGLAYRLSFGFSGVGRGRLILTLIIQPACTGPCQNS